MTLVVGVRCEHPVVLGAEQEESAGYTGKRNVYKLKLHEGKKWALGFSGAGDGAIIDNAERQLVRWLDTRETFAAYELADAIDDVLAAVYEKFIDSDKNSEGISLIIGGSCEEGLFLIQTHKRTSKFEIDYACAGYGADVGLYLLGRIHKDNDKWLDASKITAFVIHETKKSSQFCSGDSNFLVFQRPPSPLWRDLGDWVGMSLDDECQIFWGDTIHEKIISGPSWRPEMLQGYCDQLRPIPNQKDRLDPELDWHDPSVIAQLREEAKKFESEDE
jgi:20S proteasome alpha/beta subunit